MTKKKKTILKKNWSGIRNYNFRSLFCPKKDISIKIGKNMLISVKDCNLGVAGNFV